MNHEGQLGRQGAGLPDNGEPPGVGASTQATVVVVNRDGRELIPMCFDALCRQICKDFDIVLVDNGSADGSVQYVEEHFPGVKLIALAENKGFAGGSNTGIRAARGQYVALLNNDARPEPGWLAELVGALEAHPEVGFCASKMLRADHPQTIDTAGDVFHDFGAGAKRGMGQRDGAGFARREYVFGACAGAAIYRRSMLEDVGLLDEDFFLYGEDIDLSFRAQLKGYRCLFVPEARVHHQVAATAGQNSSLSMYYTRRNMLYVLLKDLPTSLWFRHMGRILFYTLAGDLALAAAGRARAVATARRDSLRAMGSMLRKRRHIQSSRRVPDDYIESLLTKGQLLTRVQNSLAQLVRNGRIALPG